MVFEEKTVSSKEIFKGRIVTLKVDEVIMPNGETAERELVGHPGGVGVVALTEDDEIILVRQYRKPIEKTILEIPAGKLEPGEDPKICGIRELEEETGYSAESFEALGYIYPSPGFTDEVTYMYLATGLERGKTHPDPDEFLDVIKMPLAEAAEKIFNNELCDAKTVAGVLKTIARKKSI